MKLVEGIQERPALDGWVVYDGDKPVGSGPGMHAAIADTVRRTGGPERCRHRLQPAPRQEMQAVAGKLGPGGLTSAEAAWCAGTMNSVPVYRRSVDYADRVLAVAERIGGRRQGLTVRFDDDSKLQLVQLRRELSHRHLIRLAPTEKTASANDEQS